VCATALSRRQCASEAPRRVRRPGFVIIPAAWLEALHTARPRPGAAVWVVAVRLLERFSIEKARTIRLSNNILMARGVWRDAKYDALDQLAAMGLISLEHGGVGCATRVTWLVDPNG
jgi:hypothetical protein